MKKIDTTKIPLWPDRVILGSADIASDMSLDILTEEEVEAINGFKHPNRKNEFVTARHLFRYLLGQLDIHTEQVTLTKEESGKPVAFFRGKKLYVSFSHSIEKVYCALSQIYDVGLDVEPLDRKINPAVLARMLNEREQNSLKQESPVALWTMKEAVVKSMGTGLRTNLCDLTIIRKDEDQYYVDFNNDKSFEICSFSQAKHQIALAY
ncbi:4'-phosphopantetheinyl transferase family protein [Gracilimonas mengyeensis]|uniref:4'-phosphopantetheinyl transferase superfamily protein n=1 Tax=Gracilimonas mengyeensis TaxID=1302730 RepID=A0A521AS77_9BACT|nr:4'-phosphopantetheinyl transferase superfamily protein [Gracilimonas mengyeensis]SMO37611.1 4'-phosphopantetheinyl transferase superfamily protein [Gracilimonas mengyeensis]